MKMLILINCLDTCMSRLCNEPTNSRPECDVVTQFNQRHRFSKIKSPTIYVLVKFKKPLLARIKKFLSEGSSLITFF